MKFSILQKTLETELAFAGSVVERAATIPVISNVVIESVDETHVRITGTDLDTTFVSIVEANVTDAGELCIAARKLTAIVKLLPRREIFFATEAKSHHARIECGQSNFKVPGISRFEFPETKVPNGIKVNLPAGLVQTFIKHTSFAITNEQSRFTLSGAKFELKGNRARMVTTDGHRLALIEATLDQESPVETDVIIPRKALLELAKLSATADAAGEIIFSEDANNLYFECGSRRLTTRKLSGAFPNYEMVIPKDNDRAATFEAAALLQAIMRVSQMSDERGHAINLTLRTGEIVVSARSAEEGEADESIDAEYDGAEINIRFQYQYVSDFINSVKGGADSRIVLSFKSSAGQVLFRPAGAENGSRLLSVIMPLK